MKVSGQMKTKTQLLAYSTKWMSAETHMEFTELRGLRWECSQQG